jgi:hypothetical protein
MRPMVTSMWRAFIVIGASLPALAGAYDCLDYGPTNLTGRVVRQTYAGPPDYESVTKGDQPLVIWLLQLERSLCVIDSQGRLPKEYAAREIQLEWVAGGEPPFRSLLGAKVTVIGELIRGGARHDKRLVITVAEMTKAPT